MSASSPTPPSRSGQVEHLTDNEQAQKTPEALNEAIRKRLSVLDPSKRVQVEKRAADAPISARQGYVRAALGETSPPHAIKAFCMECMAWDRTEVAQCTARARPLYEYGPFAKGRNEDPVSEGDNMDPESAPQ